MRWNTFSAWVIKIVRESGNVRYETLESSCSALWYFPIINWWTSIDHAQSNKILKASPNFREEFNFSLTKKMVHPKYIYLSWICHEKAFEMTWKLFIIIFQILIWQIIYNSERIKNQFDSSICIKIE